MSRADHYFFGKKSRDIGSGRRGIGRALAERLESSGDAMSGYVM